MCPRLRLSCIGSKIIAIVTFQILLLIYIGNPFTPNLSSTYSATFDGFTLQKLSLSKWNQPASIFFETVGSHDCFITGTDFTASTHQGSHNHSGSCICHQNYQGQDCGIPIEMWESSNNSNLSEWKSNFNWSRIHKRSGLQRRLIHALPVNLEIDLFEARIISLYHVVDVFLVAESNLTNSGGTRDLVFLNLFKSGWLKPYQDKIVYIFRGVPPPTGYEDGAKADAYMRSELTRQGLKSLTDLKEDDLFMYTDGDELPRPELLQFLKLYDGYPQPIAFWYKWSIFGFFWHVNETILESYSAPIPSVVSLEVLNQVYQNDSSLLRKAGYYKETNGVSKSYPELNQHGVILDQISVMNAGWHCSWCFKPEGIRAKLLDAPHSDFPRYGDDKAKTTVSYIKRLIKHGIYFNLVKLSKQENNVIYDPDYAPPFMLQHFDKYSYLLKNPYKFLQLPRNH